MIDLVPIQHLAGKKYQVFGGSNFLYPVVLTDDGEYRFIHERGGIVVGLSEVCGSRLIMGRSIVRLVILQISLQFFFSVCQHRFCIYGECFS